MITGYVCFSGEGDEKYQGVLPRLLEILNTVSDRPDHVQDQVSVVVSTWTKVLLLNQTQFWWIYFRNIHAPAIGQLKTTIQVFIDIIKQCDEPKMINVLIQVVAFA